jgi:hypothetical protein
MDPVTNSQDPDVKAFRVAAKKQGADKATVAVTIESHQRDSRANPADKTIRYDFVHEAGQWTTSRAPSTAARGRSAPCASIHSSIRICKY